MRITQYTGRSVSPDHSRPPSVYLPVVRRRALCLAILALLAACRETDQRDAAPAGETASAMVPVDSIPARADSATTIGPRGLLVMLEDGILTRISLSEGTGIRTASGIQVGDPAAAVIAAHGTEAVATPHKYQEAPARYFAVWRTPPPAPDARGIVYEIGGDDRVMHIHAGGPSIAYVEGCL